MAVFQSESRGEKLALRVASQDLWQRVVLWVQLVSMWPISTVVEEGCAQVGTEGHPWTWGGPRWSSG